MEKYIVRSAAFVCTITLHACSRDGFPTAPRDGAPPAAPVLAIEIGGGADEAAMVIGQTRQLHAKARMADGSDRDVTSLAFWISETPDVVSVDGSGLAIARSPGAGRVRASYLSATGGTSLEVIDAAPPANQSLPDAASANGGSGSAGEPGPAPGSGGGGGPGSGGSPPGGTSSIPPTVQSLTIVGTNTVPAGRTAQFRAIATMSDGSQKDVTSDADWHSNDSLTGTISQGGLFTGVVPGSNVVRANYHGASASQPVQVTPL